MGSWAAGLNCTIIAGVEELSALTIGVMPAIEEKERKEKKN